MGFRYVEDAKRVGETLDFAEIQSARENVVPKRRGFTPTPKDTRIVFVPSYLFKENEDPYGADIVYTIDKSMPASLTII